MEPNNLGQQTSTPMRSEKSIGPAVGIIVIIVVIVLGGLYFWGQRIEKQKEISTPVTPTETTVADQPATNSQSSDATVQVMQKQSSSDDLTSIQTDLNATNMSTLGTEDVGSASAASASQ